MVKPKKSGPPLPARERRRCCPRIQRFPNHSAGDALGGALDMAAAFELEPAVEELLSTDDVQALVLDLADVAFVDSAGLGAILAIRERTHQAGIVIAISRPSDPVRRLLDLTGSGELLDR